jgi:pantoate--beta-alanine ligase
MVTAATIADCRAAVGEARRDGLSIGFVPTMGALHEGHLSLIEAARARSHYVVMSVFVNPLQFGPGEDYERYPRDLPADSSLAGSRGVDLVFAPETHEMYPGQANVTLKAGRMASDWEGRARPGHFDGVLTVVAKLLHIVQPETVVFGQKDLQQARIVEAMIRDLNMPVEMVLSPTIRDSDGLALSSRNRYLSPGERNRALALSRALREIQAVHARGERDVAALERAGQAILVASPGVKIDYLAVVERDRFIRPATLGARGAAIGAIHVGTTRLIDNVLLDA